VEAGAKCWALPFIGERLPLRVTFYPPDRRRRDDDNMIASFKSARDGLADALGVDDRCFAPHYVFADPVDGGQIVVEIGQ
jgi:Holliday junction resolvase RusA-like endonuclease